MILDKTLASPSLVLTQSKQGLTDKVREGRGCGSENFRRFTFTLKFANVAFNAISNIMSQVVSAA